MWMCVVMPTDGFEDSGLLGDMAAAGMGRPGVFER
jgi:hypothetical protein